MKFERLNDLLEKIDIDLELPKYLKEICSSLISKDVSQQELDTILQNNNVNYSVAKVDFLHLILTYIKYALEDNILTTQEKSDIHFLKTYLKIHPGDFYFHNRKDIENIVSYQLSKIYDDNFVTETEALLKVDIQEIFDLSFDQMNDYSKIPAAISVNKGADPKDLDVFFSNTEYFKLKVRRE